MKHKVSVLHIFTGCPIAVVVGRFPASSRRALAQRGPSMEQLNFGRRMRAESSIASRIEKKEVSIVSNVEEIKVAIEALPKADYVQLRQWFNEKDWGRWNKQIEADSKSGKLDFLITEAVEEKKKGTLKEL